MYRALALSLVFSTVFARLEQRAPANNGNIASSYDFLIAGGGLAGLVLASRLSEDANTTVLVIEAGSDGSEAADSINVPYNAFAQSLLNTEYDWAYNTVKQSHAGNRILTWPRGKVLGGSTAINGMYLVRPNQIELDAWSGLLEGQDGADLWGWDSLFASMKETETFTPPLSAISPQADIEFNSTSHGTSGPLHYSYPGYIPSLTNNWIPTLTSLGISENSDPHSGTGWGAFVATSAINPTNWTRSYAKSAYIDPLPPRTNLKILTGNMVTRVVIQNGTATGVEYKASPGMPAKTVNVNKEVILAGGAVGSPQLLMASGVGPTDVLTNAGVNVTVALPGVGQHLQDHLSAQVVYKTTSDTPASLYRNDLDSMPKQNQTWLLSYVNNAIAYINSSIFFDDPTTFYTSVTQQKATPLSTDPTVVAGYNAIYDATANILNTPVGQVEMLFALTGTAEAGDQSIAFQVALQHPYSHGQMYITSPDVFQPPTIDPNYLAHPADVTLLREGFKLARQIAKTAPMSSVVTDEVLPGDSVQSDGDWEDWLAGQVGTEFHPTGTCAMLPYDKGGVVDAQLRVYGLSNVRVADSSVFPIEFAAHLQASTYALAEQAASIIRTQYNVVPQASASPSANAVVPSATVGQASSASSSRLAWTTVVLALLTAYILAL